MDCDQRDEGLRFDFDFDDAASGDGYDPLGDDVAAAGAEGPETPSVVQDGKADAAPKADERPAGERTAELFKRMARQRRLLIEILRFCDVPRDLAAIGERVRDLQEKHRSVFGLDNVCGQLERAGALACVLEDGKPYVYDEDAEPEVEVVDGVERIKPAVPPVMHWVVTDAGREALASYDPAAKLVELLQDDAAYLSIYERVLTLCAEEGGATMPALGKAVDGDPLVQDPRFYAAHFVNNLEACDAVSWEPNWVTTEIGLRGLEMIADGSLTAVSSRDE